MLQYMAVTTIGMAINAERALCPKFLYGENIVNAVGGLLGCDRQALSKVLRGLRFCNLDSLAIVDALKVHFLR